MAHKFLLEIFLKSDFRLCILPTFVAAPGNVYEEGYLAVDPSCAFKIFQESHLSGNHNTVIYIYTRVWSLYTVY